MNNRFSTLTQWMKRIVFANILWILFNMPVIYSALNMILSTEAMHFLTYLLFLIIFTPIFFFPATTALFGVVRKWVMGEKNIKLFPSYWQYYKENYLRSLLGGLLLTVLWLIIFIDYYYFAVTASPLFYVFLVVGIFMLVFTVNFLAITVHYDIKMFSTIKNGLKLTFGRPIHSTLMVVIIIVVSYLSFNLLPILLLLGFGSIIAYGAFKIFFTGLEKISNQHHDNVSET